jgi:TonB family protein
MEHLADSPQVAAAPARVDDRAQDRTFRRLLVASLGVHLALALTALTWGPAPTPETPTVLTVRLVEAGAVAGAALSIPAAAPVQDRAPPATAPGPVPAALADRPGEIIRPRDAAPEAPSPAATVPAGPSTDARAPATPAPGDAPALQAADAGDGAARDATPTEAAAEDATAAQAPVQSARGSADEAVNGAVNDAADNAGGAPQVEAEALDPGFGLLTPVVPRYPEAARRLGRSGQARIEVEVDRGGRVLAVRILAESGRWGFGEAARRAYLDARFSPPRRAGRPVEVRWRKTLLFRP